MKKAAYVCFVIQAIVYINIILSGEPIIPVEISNIGLIFSLLYLAALSVMLWVGLIFWHFSKKKSK